MAIAQHVDYNYSAYNYSYTVEDVLKQLAMLLGLVYFVSLMIFDACVATFGKPARIWNPGKSLLINALTIQILSFLKIKIIKFSDDDTSSIQGYFRVRQDIRQNRLVGASGRVVTCVLIGYLLPGMARAGSATDWRTLAALALSLFTFEFYYLTTLFYNPPNAAGRTIRGTLAQKISVIQWDKRKRSEEGSWQKFEGEIIKSWFLSRVCHPQYVIARSVLSSAVGLVVTICILFSITPKLDYYSFPFERWDAYDIVIVAWTLELAFILIGGTVIFCRWLMAVVYFPRFFVKKMKLTQIRPIVEDFWTRGILELVQIYDLQKWRLQEQSKDGILKGLAFRLATTMRIHYLFYLLWPLQVSLVYFSKGCLFISELLFSFKCVWNCLLGSDKKPAQSQGEFEECREILEKVCMPGENPERLWVANKKSMKQAKDRFKKSKEKGCKCTDLIDFLKSRFHQEIDYGGRFVNQLERLPLVEEHFSALDENCMRMTALSLLNVIINLLPLHRDGDKLNKAIEAYKQALELMSFVDNSDPENPTTVDVLKVIDIEADRVSVAVHNEFQRLLKLPKDKTNSSEKSPNFATPEAAINGLLNDAEKQLKEQKLIIINKEEQPVGEEYCDSRDWSAIAACYSNYRVCKLILKDGFNSENEFKKEYLYDSLADVIGHCLLKLHNVMIKTCREWAVKFEEEKIWDAMYIAGKVVGVMQECNVEVKGKILEPKFFSPTSNEIQRFEAINMEVMTSCGEID
ncbi:hypothetical protein SUGI_0579460 [Cryptomeria japonica]|nr:hypothetical protein SUGI_0579460 [Cryptomeria japonica]